MATPGTFGGQFTPIAAGGIRRESLVFAVVSLGMRAVEVVESGATDDPVFSVNGLFIAKYILADGPDFTEDDLQVFARVNGPFSVYPYWREFLASSSARMGVPHIVPPQFNPGRFIAEPFDSELLTSLRDQIARLSFPEPIDEVATPSAPNPGGTQS